MLVVHKRGHVKRRDALKLLVTSGCILCGLEESAALQAPTGKTLAHGNGDVIVDQSGLFGRGHFVVGMLTATNMKSEIAALRKLRDQTKFACRLRYNSRNKFKASFAKTAIDHWLNSSGMSIAAVAMEDTRGAASESQALQDARCIEQVAALVNGRRHKGPVSRIVTQRRHAGPRGASLENQLRKASRNVDQIVSIPDSQSDILQFLGFITGTIYGAFSGSDKPPTNKTKRELLAYVEAKLGGKPLWAPVNHPKLVLRVIGKA